MKWAFYIKEKNKLALSLLAVLIVILLATWMVNYSVGRLGKAFYSIYSDRLVPSMYSAQMQELLFQNRLYSERYLMSSAAPKQKELKRQIENNFKETDSLLSLFRQTYLVEKEEKALDIFGQDLDSLKYAQKELLVLGTSGSGNAIALLEGEYDRRLEQCLDYLRRLNDIQGEVGQELYHEAEKEVASLKLATKLVVAIAVIIALVVGVLLRGVTMPVTQMPPRDPRLN